MTAYRFCPKTSFDNAGLHGAVPLRCHRIRTRIRRGRKGAAQIGWVPEQLSPDKFYPKVATAIYLYLHRQQWEREIRTRYRHLHLRWIGHRRCWVRTRPLPVQVEPRADDRRRRRFCPARRLWKSFAHVPGGQRPFWRDWPALTAALAAIAGLVAAVWVYVRLD